MREAEVGTLPFLLFSDLDMAPPPLLSILSACLGLELWSSAPRSPPVRRRRRRRRRSNSVRHCSASPEKEQEEKSEALSPPPSILMCVCYVRRRFECGRRERKRKGGGEGERESVVPISTAFSFSLAGRNLDRHQDGKRRTEKRGKGRRTINNCIRIYDVLYGEEERGRDPWLNGQSPSLSPSVSGPLSLFLFLFLPVSQSVSRTHFHFSPHKAQSHRRRHSLPYYCCTVVDRIYSVQHFLLYLSPPFSGVHFPG